MQNEIAASRPTGTRNDKPECLSAARESAGEDVSGPILGHATDREAGPGAKLDKTVPKRDAFKSFPDEGRMQIEK